MDEGFILELLANATAAKNNSLTDPWPTSELYVCFMHFLSLLTIAQTAFASYCIRRKTVNEAKFFARLQLIHLFWASSTDLLITSFCTPTIFMPYMAGYMNGLFSLIGLDPFIQTVMCLMCLICTASSITHMLWFKAFMVLPNNHFLKREKVFRTGLFSLYPLWTVFSVASWYSLSRGIKAQWEGSLERMKQLPSQLFDYHRPAVFLLARREQSSSYKITIFAIGAYIVINVAAVAICFYYLKRLRIISMQTAKLQKKAIKALVAQSLVFFALFAVPMCIFYFSRVATEDPLPVYLSRISFFALWLASFMDTGTMILMNEGYRNALLQTTRLDRWFGVRVIVSPMGSNASAVPVE